MQYKQNSLVSKEVLEKFKRSGGKIKSLKLLIPVHILKENLWLIWDHGYIISVLAKILP